MDPQAAETSAADDDRGAKMAFGESSIASIASMELFIFTQLRSPFSSRLDTPDAPPRFLKLHCA